MIEHTLTVHGRDAGGGRPRTGMAGPLLSMLEPVVRDNLRLAFFSSSRVEDGPPDSLRNAWLIRLVGMRPGADESTEFIFELPLLGEASPQIYDQLELDANAPKPNETALDILGYTLADISARKVLSNRFDLPLLARVRQLGKILKNGITDVSLGGHRLSYGQASPLIGKTFLDTVEHMLQNTPESRRARVHGKLDTARFNGRVLELLTNSGEHLRIAWTPHELPPLSDVLNRTVLIEGEAMFRPTGALLRIDADAIRLATAGDEFFSLSPRPTGNMPGRKVDLLTRSCEGFKGITGTWPGDESIEDLLDTLAELGR